MRPPHATTRTADSGAILARFKPVGALERAAELCADGAAPGPVTDAVEGTRIEGYVQAGQARINLGGLVSRVP